jgi:hypothetical protein
MARLLVEVVKRRLALRHGVARHVASTAASVEFLGRIIELHTTTEYRLVLPVKGSVFAVCLVSQMGAARLVRKNRRIPVWLADSREILPRKTADAHTRNEKKVTSARSFGRHGVMHVRVTFLVVRSSACCIVSPKGDGGEPVSIPRLCRTGRHLELISRSPRVWTRNRCSAHGDHVAKRHMTVHSLFSIFLTAG